MIFTELRFFGFFLIVFAVHWVLKKSALRKLWLLAASYVFYGAWDWRFLGLIIGSTLVDYYVALGIQRYPDKARRLLILSLCTNLGALGIFKYLNFFASSFIELSTSLGLPISPWSANIILPVGISFYTFQTLSYTIDVYRGNLTPKRSLLDFALFVAFFPQLVAGPIVRAAEFLPQLDTEPQLRKVDFRWALGLFLVGFIKKGCISDNIAQVVDTFFKNPTDFSPLGAVLGVLSYATQIYCDFSGYSDMAIATSALLGYRLTTNFDAPYLSTSITEFWRRWHISLSSWLRDYLYFTLGGNRRGELNTYRNLMLTMVLGGLWHGASWNFVIWGALHGVALALDKLRMRGRPKHYKSSQPAQLLGWAITFSLVILAWIPFRAPTLSATVTVMKVMFGASAAGAQLPGSSLLLFGLPLLLGIHYLWHRRTRPLLPESLPPPVYAMSYGVAWSLTLALKATGYQPFIYFQF